MPSWHKTHVSLPAYPGAAAGACGAGGWLVAGACRLPAAPLAIVPAVVRLQANTTAGNHEVVLTVGVSRLGTKMILPTRESWRRLASSHE
jgi:hypothetical protein